MTPPKDSTGNWFPIWGDLGTHEEFCEDVLGLIKPLALDEMELVYNNVSKTWQVQGHAREAGS